MAKIRTYVSVVNAIFSQLADGKNWVVDLLWWPFDSRHCWWNMLLPSGKFQSNHQINWNSLILRWRRHEECPVTVSNVFQCWAISNGFVSVFYRLLQWTEVKYIFPRNFLFLAAGTTINSLGYLSSTGNDALGCGVQGWSVATEFFICFSGHKYHIVMVLLQTRQK